MSGLPLLMSQQSDTSTVYDINQNQRSDTSMSSSQSSSGNVHNSQTPLLEENSSPDSAQGRTNNFLNHRTSSIPISVPGHVTEIKIHGSEPFKLSADDLNLSVHETIKKILKCEKYNMAAVGPAGLQLFGIASIDPKRSCKCIWKNPQAPIRGLESSSGSTTSALYLRIRFIPSKDRVEKLRNLGKEIVHYLYNQCKDDFVDDRLKQLYGKEISSAKARGLAVLDMAITSKLSGRSVDDILNKQFDLKHFLPSRERVTFWKKYKLKGNMKPHVVKLHEQQLDAEDMMIGYIRDILHEVIEYTIERYSVKYRLMDGMNEDKVTVLTDIHHEPSGVHIGKNHFSTVEDIRSINIKPNYGTADSSWIVHLDRSSGHPEEITFSSEEEAASFVSGVDGYYRLIHDYYFSLCHQVEPPSVRELKVLKCFGPIENEVARQKLRRQDTLQEDFYLLTQSDSCFNEYSLHYTYNGQNRKKVLTQLSGNRFCFKGKEDIPFENFTELLKNLTSENQLPSGVPSRIPRRIGRPNIAEACGILKRLFIEEMEAILDEDAERESSGQRLKRQPRIFQPSEIHINELLNVGHFTEVHNAVLDNEKTVAVKVLRQARPEQLFRCYEPFQQSIMKQISFSDPHFMNIQGVCLTTPLRVVMDYAPYGSLATFFVRRQPDQPLYLHHLMYAATQVAEGLLYLAELSGTGEICHGNICCQNIMVHRYEFNNIVVKIGDPGMILLYNKLPITDKINSKRLPWIAPERFTELSAMNIKSDVYAFGTTMWEMFTQGCNPLDYPPLSGLKIDEIQQFYLSGKMIGRPQGLQERPEDSKEIKRTKDLLFEVMMSCWVLDATERAEAKEIVERAEAKEIVERAEAKEIVRNLHQIGATYGESYHVYSEIPEDILSGMSSNNMTSSSSAVQESDNVPDILPHLLEYESSAGNSASAVAPPGSTVPPGVRNPVGVNQPSRIVSPIQPVVPNSIPNTNNLPNGGIIPVPANQNGGSAAVLSNAGMNQNPELNRTTPKVSRNRPPLPETPDPLTNIRYLISLNSLRIDPACIGKGHYGEVYKGQLNDSLRKCLPIAAKKLGYESESVLDHPEFKKEAELMCMLSHCNVVRFIGICDNMVIMEYVENGSMNAYLRQRRKKSRQLPVSNIVQIIEGVAKGMEYIYQKSNRRIIHCDLAGRNILLDKDLVPKISDFGLAKALSQDKDYYRRSHSKELPLKWCAPEAINHRRFTTKSDVWSYGIVIWEAITHGKTPYSDWKPFDTTKFEKGDRLPQTEECPDDLYDLMKLCWRYKAEERPEFEEIVVICGDLKRQYPVPVSTQQPASNQGAASSAITSTVNPVLAQTADRRSKVNSKVDNEQTWVKETAVKLPHQQKGDNEQTDLKRPVINDGKTDFKKSVQPLTKENQETGLKKTISVNNEETGLKRQSAGHNHVTESKKPFPIDGDQKTMNGQDKDKNGNTARINIPSQNSDTTKIVPEASQMSVSPSSNPCSPSGGISPSALSSLKGRQLPSTPLQIGFFINSKELIVERNIVLGQGQYGAVYKGTYKGEKVAAKVLDKNIQDKLLIDKEFKDEIEVLAQLQHDKDQNDKIVQFIGLKLDEYMIIMEYMEKGSLLKYLQNHKQFNRMLSCRQILEICRDIAEGMDYLSSKNILHCDLAARNVLLTKERKIKISDFGLSKVLMDDKDYYRRSKEKAVPAFWSAPEVLAHKKMSVKGDVWSYGVVMWECFTHGENPNICKTVEELKLIGMTLLFRGVRLQKPDNCPKDVYELMKKCWDYDPLLRPPFSEILKACRIFLNKLDKGETLD